MKNLTHQILDTIKIVVLAAIMVVGVQYVFATSHSWQGPGGTPPTNNTEAPINVGNIEQQKNGVLDVNGLKSQLGFTMYGGILDIQGGNTSTFSGGINSQGAITGTSITATGASGITANAGPVSGTSLNIGGTEVISSSKIGTFSGGVVVGAGNNGTEEYLQIDMENLNGFAPNETCNVSNGGKMIVDSHNDNIFICLPFAGVWHVLERNIF